MTTPEFFSYLEIVIFIVAIAGISISSVSLSEAMKDVRARRDAGINGRVMLIATKNRRIAWVLLLYFIRQAVLYGYAMTQSPTVAQLYPSVQSWMSYLTDAGMAVTFLWFICRNYGDYMKAQRYAREFNE